MTSHDAMLTDGDLHDDYLLDHAGAIVAERHRTDDPSVWGLLDVARGRTPASPTTIYKTKGDSASGVAGRLTPDGVFHPVHTTRIGNEFVCGLLHDVKPSPSEPTTVLVTAWDGARPSDPFEVENDDGSVSVRREHTRGELLGDYGIRRDIDRGGKEIQRRTHRGTKGATTMKAGSAGPQGLLIIPDHGPCYREAA